jgi:glutathione S-transferase
MRARLAIAASGQKVELREILLRDKPADFLATSPKGTVPVLKLEDGQVIDESRDIMFWALGQNDPENWLAVWRQIRLRPRPFWIGWMVRLNMILTAINMPAVMIVTPVRLIAIAAAHFWPRLTKIYSKQARCQGRSLAYWILPACLLCANSVLPTLTGLTINPGRIFMHGLAVFLTRPDSAGDAEISTMES